MSFSEDLIDHASTLLGNSSTPPAGMSDYVDMRRPISAAYYAVFHHLSEAVVQQIAPGVSSEAANRIYRWLNHGEMKRICREFASPQLRSPSRERLTGGVSADMQQLAASFIILQEARHNADYDLSYLVTWEGTRDFIELALRAMRAWDQMKQTAEGNIFILSLLLWKNWEKER